MSKGRSGLAFGDGGLCAALEREIPGLIDRFTTRWDELSLVKDRILNCVINLQQFS